MQGLRHRRHANPTSVQTPGILRSRAHRWQSLADVKLPASVLLLGLAIALPIVTFAVAYNTTNRAYAALPLEERWPKGYFLSAALDVHPAANFGAFFLTASLVSLFCTTCIRHMIVARRLPPGSEQMHRLSVALAFIASLGGNGVAAFPHHDDRRMHNAMAATFFVGNLLHFVLEVLLERREPLGVRAGQRAARFWHGLIVSLATMCTFTFLAHILFEEMGNRELHIGKQLAAAAEIATVSCFLIYIGTYYRSFAATRLHLSISIDGERSDPAWSDARKERTWSDLPSVRSPKDAPTDERGRQSPGSSHEMLELLIDSYETIAAETLNGVHESYESLISPCEGEDDAGGTHGKAG